MLWCEYTVFHRMEVNWTEIWNW